MPETDREALRDAAIRAVLPSVPRLGWTAAALREAAGPDADLLFPGGPGEMVEAYIDLADREMVAAVRRALGVLAMPGQAARAARCTARTVDTIWHAAGDRSADFSWYTKRAILTGVYCSTLLYWVSAARPEADTLAFLDRRLAGVARLGRWRRHLSERFA